MKQDKSMNKTERELFEEEMAKWPEELEREFEEIRKRSKKLNETPAPQFNSVKEVMEYYDAISWEDYINSLLSK